MKNKKTIIIIMLLIVSFSITQISISTKNIDEKINQTDDYLLRARIQRAGLFEDHCKLEILNYGKSVSYELMYCRMIYPSLKETNFAKKILFTISSDGTFSNGNNEFDVILPEDQILGPIRFILLIHFTENGVESPCYDTHLFRIGNFVITSNNYISLVF